MLHVETGRHLYGGPQQVIYLVPPRCATWAMTTRWSARRGSGTDNAARSARLPDAQPVLRGRSRSCRSPIDCGSTSAESAAGYRPLCTVAAGPMCFGGHAANFARRARRWCSRRVDNTEMRRHGPALRYRPFRKVIAISETVLRTCCSERGVPMTIRLVGDHAAPSMPNALPSPAGPVQRVPPSEFGFRRRCDVSSLLIVGQLIPRKGHRYLLEALAGLHARPVSRRCARRCCSEPVSPPRRSSASSIVAKSARNLTIRCVRRVSRRP